MDHLYERIKNTLSHHSWPPGVAGLVRLFFLPIHECYMVIWDPQSWYTGLLDMCEEAWTASSTLWATQPTWRALPHLMAKPDGKTWLTECLPCDSDKVHAILQWWDPGRPFVFLDDERFETEAPPSLRARWIRVDADRLPSHGDVVAVMRFCLSLDTCPFDFLHVCNQSVVHWLV